MAMSIAEFVSDPARMRGYSEWLNNPMTRELLEMAREYRFPGPLRTVKGEEALYQYGLLEGANLVIMLLTKMDELVRQQEIAQMLAQEPDYGADKIVEEMFK